MEVMFDIKKANKVSIDSPEHYIVEYDGMVLMRVFGVQSQYYLVTATAGEDLGAAIPYHNQPALLAAANQAASMMKISAWLMHDSSGRKYVEFSPCEYLSDIYRASEIILKCLTSHCSEQA